VLSRNPSTLTSAEIMGPSEISRAPKVIEDLQRPQISPVPTDRSDSSCHCRIVLSRYIGFPGGAARHQRLRRTEGPFRLSRGRVAARQDSMAERRKTPPNRRIKNDHPSVWGVGNRRSHGVRPRLVQVTRNFPRFQLKSDRFEPQV
jgi:hypothetical protein